MQTCGSPNQTYSMMDEYTSEMEKRGCYVNPFVGEGRYARYLRTWLSIVPKRQIFLLNFDEWVHASMEAMEAISQFLQLPPFRSLSAELTLPGEAVRPYGYNVADAHNTHGNRSVHVRLAGHTNIKELDSVEEQLGFSTQCVLNEFFRPYMEELSALLQEYGYPPMVWRMDIHIGLNLSCPQEYRFWGKFR
mmetsp:Transcript_12136/g.20490  ORF Transcript_12136/g.20490 Transcript_12136/m.20490 type:complete len:191 (-) Transcript_12136:117-689(-)